MYKYDEVDFRLVRERVEQFRSQTQRYLAGELSEEEFRPLRLMNGLYIQRHAPMLRVAIPYGHFSSLQMRKLAHIARTYDRGYGHFTTRQNIQFNWPELASSRLPYPVAKTTAPPPRCTISACTWCATTPAKLASACW